jgi:hypothetical protein
MAAIPLEFSMRLASVAALVIAAAAASTIPAVAENDLPSGVAELLVCSHVYSMKSEEATAAGDEAASLELFNMGDALLVQAQNTLLEAGYTADQIDDIDMNFALTTGFNYASDQEKMLATCLAAWDSP